MFYIFWWPWYIRSAHRAIYKPVLCTNKFIVAFLVPKLFVATHWYKPLSTGRKFLIVSLPSLTLVFPAGKGIISLIQVSLGGGYPSAWQVSCIWANSIFDTNDEGFLVKIGRFKMTYDVAWKSYSFDRSSYWNYSEWVPTWREISMWVFRRPVHTSCVSRKNDIQVEQLVRIMVQYMPAY